MGRDGATTHMPTARAYSRWSSAAAERTSARQRGVAGSASEQRSLAYTGTFQERSRNGPREVPPKRAKVARVERVSSRAISGNLGQSRAISGNLG